MNTEEARNTLWLKSNPRPLGELLDEGYLTEDRLQWAAEWAYNPKLKQAAKILLENLNISSEVPAKETQDSSIPVGISLEKARTTPWPFPPYKNQPMGELVESRRLSLKDLGYAIENAWDEKIRQAAIALTLVRLEQTVKEPVPSAGFIKIISGGRSYSEKQVTRLTMLEGLIFGIALTFMLGVGIKSVQTKPESGTKTLADIISTPAGLIAFVLVTAFVIGASWLFNYLTDLATKGIEKKISEYRLGQDGEDKIIQLILQALDGNWSLFRNIQLPGRNKGDLDIVLVGPPGIWVLEVKNYNGEYRNIGDQWEYRHGKKWKSASSNPSQQAFKNAIRLANFLKADGLNVFVNAVVAWVNEEKNLIVDNPFTAVWTYSRLADELGNIWQNEKLSKDVRESIIDKLSRLCEEKM